MMNSICLIPARGGSKRIYKKNIYNFHGKPLIAWSIECAINSGLFENVIVSTDDYEIKNISEKYGAKVPFIRPKEISDDFSSDKDVRNHFINWFNKNNEKKIDILCYLYATAPFISVDTLIGCNNDLIKNDCGCVFTITDYAFHPLRALTKNSSGKIQYFLNEYSDKRSQDLPELFHDAGQCYFFNLNKTNYEDDRLGYKISRTLSQDIDTVSDLKFAEILFNLIKK